MKKFKYVFSTLLALFAVALSACGYSKQTKNIINIAEDCYAPYYAATNYTAEVVVSATSPYVYYFAESESGYTMKRDRLISYDLYLDSMPEDYFYETITYTADGVIMLNGEKAATADFSYNDFKSYCLSYYGDSVNDNFTSVIYSIVQSCLAQSTVYTITESDNYNICYVSNDINLLGNCTAYMSFLQGVLSEDEYMYFTEQLDVLSSTTQKTVTVEIVADSNYTTVYPHIVISHNGINWLDIDLVSFIAGL